MDSSSGWAVYRRENDNVRRIELSVIPRIDISTVGVPMGKGEAPGIERERETRARELKESNRGGTSRVSGSVSPSQATRNNRLVVTCTDIYLFTPSSR